MEVGRASGELGEVRGRAEIEYVLHCQTVNKIYLNEYKTLSISGYILIYEQVNFRCEFASIKNMKLYTHRDIHIHVHTHTCTLCWTVTQ